jgi:hypothetical protein
VVPGSETDLSREQNCEQVACRQTAATERHPLTGKLGRCRSDPGPDDEPDERLSQGFETQIGSRFSSSKVSVIPGQTNVSPEGDWNAHAFSDIRELFFDPKANRASARNVWLVQQANLYVTQVGEACKTD